MVSQYIMSAAGLVEDRVSTRGPTAHLAAGSAAESMASCKREAHYPQLSRRCDLDPVQLSLRSETLLSLLRLLRMQSKDLSQSY